MLVYSAVASDTGYRALGKLRGDARTHEAELMALQDRRIALEKRAELLRSKALDPDMIDERIRMVLGYSREGDIIIPRRELDPMLQKNDK